MTIRASADRRIVDRVLHRKTFYGRRILLGANMRAMTAVNISNRRHCVELTTVSALCVAAIQADAAFGSGTRQMRPDLFAFATACAFFGAALYVNIVEQPARLALDARSIVREWMPSNRRGFLMLAVLAIISALSGYAEYVGTGDVRWLIGGTIILATWPYAYFVMIPVNVLLYDARRNAPASVIRDLMRDWGLLEWGQTAIGLSAACMFAWTFVSPA